MWETDWNQCTLHRRWFLIATEYKALSPSSSPNDSLVLGTGLARGEPRQDWASYWLTVGTRLFQRPLVEGMREVLQGHRRSLGWWKCPCFPPCLSWKWGFMFWMRRVADGAVLTVCASDGEIALVWKVILWMLLFLFKSVLEMPLLCLYLTQHPWMFVCLIWDFRNV